DLAAAHVLALKLLLQGHSGGVLNLGTGTGFSVREFLAAIATETGREVPHVVKPRRAGDPTYLVADASAARATLNFRTTHSDLPRIAPSRDADSIGATKGISMHPAAKLQFERIIVEFARWRALPKDDRPPAPAWWWGPAVEVRDVDLPLSANGSGRLGLPDGA